MTRSIPTLLAMILVSGAAQAASPENAACLTCHDAKQHKVTAKAAIDMGAYDKSVHTDVACVECHTDAKGDSCKQGLAKATCGGCHEKEEKQFAVSAHGVAKTKDGAAAVLCSNCHGTHDTLKKTNPKSSVYAKNQPQTCAECHDKKDGKKTGFRLDTYLQSAHWQGVAKDGLVVSATCVSCHGNHDMRGKADAKSKVARANLPATCGKCHEGMAEEYLTGVHGQALKRGSADTPICTDCHGDHGIRDHEDPKSSVYASTVSKMTCPQCHKAEYINRRYGLPSGQVESYEKTFHGLADQFGDTTVANCASCHGAHQILPPSDPRSSVSTANLPETCGKCHPGAGANFAKGSAHEPASKAALGATAVNWVRWIYLGIIAVSLSGMFLHNALDYYATLRERYRASKGKKRYQRFTVGERVQHLVLVLTFGVLVFTGFALKYPDAFWVKPVLNSQFGFLARGYAHRVAAVAFMVASLYHLYYLFATRRGRSQLKAMIPGKQDARDAWQQIKYYLGFAVKPAFFARFTYAEKFEYLALIWGSIVMIVTGLILWFEEGALAWLPKWGWDIADIIHLYEAWLASMSILVWHLYHVAFKPSGHGVSMVMATGDMTEEEMKHEHPAELETLQASAEEQPEEEHEAHHGKGTSYQPV
ncbi:MAG: cytochrome c3 family protein [Polyangiaceae bacterium]